VRVVPDESSTDPIVRVVAAEDAGIRLDLFLARQPEIGARERAKELIAQGRVRVGAARVRPGLALVGGQAVVFSSEPPTPHDVLAGEGEAPVVRVLYADPWLLAIDKPAGLASHPPESRQFRGHTVASWARAAYGELPAIGGADRPGIVHRLDRDTSGVMVLARNEEAFHFLGAQFKSRTAEKEYRCICFGESRFESDWIDRGIATDPLHPDRMNVVAEGGRESLTYYEVIERFRGFTFFRCRPKTGRTHQIRVHMTSVGHSLVGDRLYRSRRAQHQELPAGAPDPCRQCLHAFRLRIQHPHTLEELEFEAPLPADMERLLRWLRDERPYPGV
jgi:23S rRNA pseudouridine1911/1915/1917 synthase